MGGRADPLVMGVASGEPLPSMDVGRRVLDTLREVETDGSVYDMSVNGFPVWWFLRVHVHNALLGSLLSPEREARKGVGRRPVLSTFGRVTTGLVRQLLLRVHRPVLFFAGSNSFGSSAGRLARPGQHRLFGQVYNALPRAGRVFVEKPTDGYSDRHSLLHHGELIFWDWMLAFSASRRFLDPLPKVVGLPEFRERLRHMDTLPLDARLVERAILQQISLHLPKIVIQLGAAELLVRLLRPLVIVEITSYDSAAVALNLVAKKNGVPVVELQHGVIYPGHPGYSAYPPKHQTMNPLPNRMLVYGDWFKQSLIVCSGLISPDMVSVVGSPRLSSFRAEMSDGKRKQTRAGVRGRLGVAPDECLITVTTQPLANGILAEFLDQFLTVMPDVCHLCIKVHPGEADRSTELYGSLGGHPRVHIATDQTFDLYDLLISSDVHASPSSTVILEAMALGTPSLAISLKHLPTISSLVPFPQRWVVTTPSSLAEQCLALAFDAELRSKTIASELLEAERFFSETVDFPTMVMRELAVLTKGR